MLQTIAPSNSTAKQQILRLFSIKEKKDLQWSYCNALLNELKADEDIAAASATTKNNDNDDGDEGDEGDKGDEGGACKNVLKDKILKEESLGRYCVLLFPMTSNNEEYFEQRQSSSILVHTNNNEEEEEEEEEELSRSNMKRNKSAKRRAIRDQKKNKKNHKSSNHLNKKKKTFRKKGKEWKDWEYSNQHNASAVTPDERPPRLAKIVGGRTDSGYINVEIYVPQSPEDNYPNGLDTCTDGNWEDDLRRIQYVPLYPQKSPTPSMHLLPEMPRLMEPPNNSTDNSTEENNKTASSGKNSTGENEKSSGENNDTESVLKKFGPTVISIPMSWIAMEIPPFDLTRTKRIDPTRIDPIRSTNLLRHPAHYYDSTTHTDYTSKNDHTSQISHACHISRALLPTQAIAEELHFRRSVFEDVNSKRSQYRPGGPDSYRNEKYVRNTSKDILHFRRKQQCEQEFYQTVRRGPKGVPRPIDEGVHSRSGVYGVLFGAEVFKHKPDQMRMEVSIRTDKKDPRLLILLKVSLSVISY
jgi:hypothetical protein